MSIVSDKPNILLIIADDLGQANVSITGRGTTRAIAVHNVDDGGVDITGAMPNTSRLLRNGLYFSGAWAHPACSPTRASIYTGLHPWKHGVGSPNGNAVLDPQAGFKTLPNMLPVEYASALFGKWHLGTVKDASTPTDHGWVRHIGTLGGELPDYYVWSVVDSANGYAPVALDAHVDVTQYATLRTVRDAAAWINGQPVDTPWFVTVAFNAPHEPFHIPPGGYDVATAGDPAGDDYMFNAMAQNLDSAIGRLLGTFGKPDGPRYFPPVCADQLSNTIVIFIGDNGTPPGIALEEHKMEIYEGGVRVPMIVTDGQALMNEINGQAVVPRFLHASRVNATDGQQIHVVDLYATVARLADPAADAFPDGMDAIDFSSVIRNPATKGSGLLHGSATPTWTPPLFPIPNTQVRPFNFSQKYDVDGRCATLRNARYKLDFDDQYEPSYSLYAYVNGEIPGLEYPNVLDASLDLLGDAQSGANADAKANLDVLHAELLAHYQQDESNAFPPLPRT